MSTASPSARAKETPARSEPLALGIEIFSDGANVEEMVAAYRAGSVHGFTTNPTLMRKAGISDYIGFARKVLTEIRSLPISFEVFEDYLDGMLSQARELARLGDNVFVKIPVTNTEGVSTAPVIAKLSSEGIRLNVTAITTTEQVTRVCAALSPTTEAVISVFAGRIADTGRDPMPVMRESVRIAQRLPLAKVLWASPREVLNIYQAAACGCHIITVTPALQEKLAMRDRSLEQVSLETVQMFRNDAVRAGYTI